MPRFTLCAARAMCAFVFIASPLMAEDQPPALFPLIVNEIPRGEALAIISPDDVLLTLATIEELGLGSLKPASKDIRGELFVSLQSLAPDVTFKFNESDFTISLLIAPRLLGTRTIELGRSGGSESTKFSRDRSSFLNYAFAGEVRRAPSLFSELGTSFAGKLLYTGLAANQEDGLTRGLTNLTIDRPGSLRRLVVGDAAFGTDLLGGSGVIGGLSLGRDFDLQPYFVRYPTLALSGRALTPSTVDVFVNGQLTNRVRVEPGLFNLRDIPASGGLGGATLVIRDAFGRESIQSGSFYYSTLTLAKGLTDYSFSVGSLREDLTKSFAYGDPAAYARYSRGVTDWLTVGGRAEGSRNLFSVGPRIAVRSRLGEIELSGATSSRDGKSGWAGLGSYRFITRRGSVGAALVRMSDQYSNLSLRPGDDRLIEDLNAFASMRAGILNLGLTANFRTYRDAESADSLSLETSAPIGRKATLLGSITVEQHSGQRDTRGLIGVTVYLARNTSAYLQAGSDNSGTATRIHVRKTVGSGTGFGYSLEKDSGFGGALGSVEYQGPFGRYQLTADPQSPGQASLSASGGLVYIGKRVMLTRSVQDSFALARVGVPGVRIFASNQEIGKTNRFGDLLIPNLLPYYSNELRIEDKDVPLEYEVKATRIVAVPSHRGGALATFPVTLLRTFTGSVTLSARGGEVIPEYGQIIIRHAGSDLTFPLGHGAEFFLENLPPGTYEAQIEYQDLRCVSKILLPESREPVTRIGVLQCKP